MSPSRFVKQSLDFVHAINEAQGMFGHVQFMMLTTALALMVLAFFTTITLFFNDQTFFEDWRYITMIAGFMGLSIVGQGITAFMPEITHKLVVQTENLVDKLESLSDDFEDEEMIQFKEGKLCRFEKAKQHICKKLKAFEGFCANNFFVIRRPLLTAITANIVTYFIVLLQFKISEAGCQNEP